MSQIQIASLVSMTVAEISPAARCLPGPVSTVFIAFHKTHKIWHWYRKGRLYSNPASFAQLTAGHGLNILTDSSLLRVASVCVLIATRILECVEQQAKLRKACDKWIDSVRGDFAAPVQCSWEVKSGRGWFSASTIIWWRYQRKSLTLRVEWIAICTFQVGKQLFILSMRIMDTVDAFSLSTSNQREGVTELFINGAKWASELEEHKKILTEGLIANKEVIEKILVGMHLPLTADKLIKTTEESLDTAEKAHKIVKGICNPLTTFVTSCGHRWGYEFLYDVGLNNLVPAAYVPPVTLPWETPQYEKMKGCFPPDESITRPSKLPPPPKTKLVPQILQFFHLKKSAARKPLDNKLSSKYTPCQIRMSGEKDLCYPKISVASS